MARYPVVMLKVVRVTGWPLLILVIGYILTGYALAGEYGLGRLIRPQLAWRLHRVFHPVLVTLLAAHSLPAAYLAMRRWGWIRR